MKTEAIAQRSGEKNNMKKDMIPEQKLSEQAFYLIALAKLIKKEFALKSLEKFMTPGIVTDYYDNAA